MFKNLDSKNLYENTDISFNFEFFTPLNKRELAAKFSRALNKKIKWFSEINNSFEATSESFKLSPVYSNEYKETSLSTGFIPYQEAINVLLKVFNVIESIGYTTDSCETQLKIRINEEEIGLTEKVEKLNKLKFLIKVNESRLINIWKNNSTSYSKVEQNPIRFIQPRNPHSRIFNENNFLKIDINDFKFSNSESFVNDFSEIGRGHIISKYIGGKDYQYKKKESIETINILIESLYSTLNSNYEYSESEKEKLKKLTEELKDTIFSTSSYLNLKKKYPNIELTVDLKEDSNVINQFYNIFREKIYHLLTGGNITEGKINYDSERKVLQLKDAKIKRGSIIENIEFYQCTIESDLIECLIEGCTITHSKLENCSIRSNNFIKSSKLINCGYLGEANEIRLSYLDNLEDRMINAELYECLVNRGKFTLRSKVDKETKIINKF